MCTCISGCCRPHIQYRGYDQYHRPTPCIITNRAGIHLCFTCVAEIKNLICFCWENYNQSCPCDLCCAVLFSAALMEAPKYSCHQYIMSLISILHNQCTPSHNGDKWHMRWVTDKMNKLNKYITNTNCPISEVPTSKTSSSSILVPKTTIPLVSMMGLGFRRSFWVVFFLQSRMRVMVCLCTLMATRCHLERRGEVNSHAYWVTSCPLTHS